MSLETREARANGIDRSMTRPPSKERGKTKTTNLDNRYHIGGGIFEFGHVHIKMIQLVSFGALRDESGSFANSMDTSKVGSRVKIRVWWSGNRDLGYGYRIIPRSKAGGLERRVGVTSTVYRNRLAFILLVKRGSTGIFSSKDTHDR